MKVLALLVLLPVSLEISAAPNFYSYLAMVDSLDAKFKQEILDSEGNLLELSEGSMSLERPNKYRWLYQTPFSKEIVCDGKKLWVFDSDLEQVVVTESIPPESNFLALALNGETAFGEYYSVRSVEKNGMGDERFVLASKTPSSIFDTAYIDFSDQVLSGFELRTGANRILRIYLKEVITNGIIEPGKFTFDIPLNVDVVKSLLN